MTGVILAVIIVLLPYVATHLGASTAPPVVAGTLSVANSTFPLSPEFFGVNVHVVGIQNQTLATLVNATPFVSFRFSPLGEATDQVHSLTYSPNGAPSPVYAETDAEFVSWCRSISCNATMMVPAEIDNASEAVATVRYVEQNLSFHPQYWAIGNEPQQWTHFGIPWTSWRSTDSSTPTPLQYALEVQQYVTAMRTFDSSIKIIGIESVVGGNLAEAWFRDLVQVDGPNLTAVAYHAYPLGNGSASTSLANFFNGLTNPTAFPLNYPVTEAIVRTTCPWCDISVFVDEFNAGLGGSVSNYMTSYPEVPFVGAALISAMLENVSRVMFFDLEDLNALQPYGLTTIGGGVRPGYLLYSTFLDHLAFGSVVNATVLGGPNGVYDVLTTNDSATSLFVVNTNLTDAVSVTLPSTVSLFNQPLTEYVWDAADSQPSAPSVVDSPFGIPWVVAPQSLLMLVWDHVY